MSIQDPDTKEFMAFLRMALLPMMVIKIGILYFGIHYSMYPGEGYGYGLAAFVAFTMASGLVFTFKQTRRRKHD